ncbi:hypothetical protein [Longimicrobium terrae]|uniref:Uncharacterized protein n=1 Tax=Longimicrobium terrae TaxID=1639882 RepID=A0A841GT14_9BACT|nr:hypothetical protein [Longimicrobium terrae]MBB4635205.1 hypothetical protein [Longimicrobium terrae]MBB6069599.1 hypothetical protein [Longimicrobium terrae]NNC31599.1 hypothetical protein [Longimicrobium terrae]
MSSRAKWLVTLGMMVFVGFMVYSSIPRSPNSCQVCLQFGDRKVCRRGAGETEADARRAAQESACGGNAHGMTEQIACRNATPVSVNCTGA